MKKNNKINQTKNLPGQGNNPFVFDKTDKDKDCNIIIPSID